jgi:orotidine-5'-phosphate decarboxylase
MNLNFPNKLARAITQNDSLLCIGLDPDPDKLPASVGTQANPVLSFNTQIIDATADLVCAYKPNFAFFGLLGERGWSTLKATLDHIPETIPVILDAKVGDIGSTAEHYARMFLDELGVDALTVNPYMGQDAVAPFLERREKGVFLLCLTSNKGAEDFEKQNLEDGPLYLRVARKAREWSPAGNCGLVVGATQPEAIQGIRALVPDRPLLIPGVGAQGGDLKTAVSSGQDACGNGVLINASRSILYAGDGPDFAAAARRTAMELRREINACRTRSG